MAALWLFCGATINTLGEYKPPEPHIVMPTSPAPAGGDAAAYHRLSAPNIVIATDDGVDPLPNVDVLLHDGVWFLEVALASAAALLIVIVLWRFATAHDCWRQRMTKLARLPLNLARQKAERTKRKSD